jgi:hypothetical protein
MKCRLMRVWVGIVLASALVACSSAPPGEFSGAVTSNVGDGRTSGRPGSIRPLGDPMEMHALPGAPGANSPDGAQ